MRVLVEEYKASLRIDRHVLLNKYRLVDVAHKVVFYFRQLRDMKLSVDLETLTEEGFIEYCRFCGWALARAHARSGDPVLISGYLGRKDVFDRAIATFAETYADQTERDYATLIAHIQAAQAPLEGAVDRIGL